MDKDTKKSVLCASISVMELTAINAGMVYMHIHDTSAVEKRTAVTEYAYNTYGYVDYIGEYRKSVDSVPGFMRVLDNEDAALPYRADVYYYVDADLGFRFFITDYTINNEPAYYSDYAEQLYKTVKDRIQGIEDKYNVGIQFESHDKYITCSVNMKDATGLADAQQAADELVQVLQVRSEERTGVFRDFGVLVKDEAGTVVDTKI